MDIKSYNYYRINFNGNLEIDYKSNFEDCRQTFFLIKELRSYLKSKNRQFSITPLALGKVPLTMSWWHYEPYTEFTYALHKEVPQEDVNEINHILIKAIAKRFPDEDISIQEIEGPGWYHDSEEEHMFELMTMVKGCDLAEEFYNFEEAINAGKGLEKQYVRKCHLLANQLGINYKLEGKYLFWRSILCFMFYFLGHKKAVWIYTKIFRQKY